MLIQDFLLDYLLPAESQAPCDATSRSGLPSRHAVDSKSHLLEYVLPSDPQTGSYSNVQPPGQSKNFEKEKKFIRII